MRTLEVIILGTQHAVWKKHVNKCRKIVCRYADMMEICEQVSVINKEREANAKHLEELLSSTRATMYRYVNHDKIVCT